MQKVTIRVPAELWKQVRHRSIEDGRSAERIVVEALRAALRPSTPPAPARRGRHR
jgi:hypothetical protein